MATFAKLEKRPDPFDSSIERWTVMNVIKVGNKTQPFASWIKQEDGVTWKAPVPYPTITTYKDNGADVNYNIFWNENDLEWKALDWDSPRNTFAWDSDNLVWIQQ